MANLWKTRYQIDVQYEEPNIQSDEHKQVHAINITIFT